MLCERPDGEAIFNRAAEIESPQERAAYLDEACGDDAELRASVEKLLQADESGKRLFRAPMAAAREDRPITLPSEKPGDVIGRYKLLEQIGEGGFGVVYMAEQTEPVRRGVQPGWEAARIRRPPRGGQALGP